LYDLYVTAEAHDGTITAQVGVTGDTPYQAVQWYLCYDNQAVDVVSIQRVSAAPLECASKADSGERVLLGCLHYSGPYLDYSGDAWTITFSCLRPGETRLAIAAGPGTSDVWLSSSTPMAPVTRSGTTVSC
jgi:hypothetical protein